MDRIDTISELLSLSNSQFRIYDIGRRIAKMSKDTFNKVEQNQLPYPFPSQGQASLAIAFWQPPSKSPYLWFVRLPLDERGLLNQGARNHFIAIIIEALGSDLTQDPSEKQEELLKSNPYNFQPAEYKLATLNSMLKVELKQAASIHFETAQEYISGQRDWQDWQTIGIQGISDVAARIEEPATYKAIATNIGHYPAPVLNALCLALENYILPVQVIDELIRCAKQAVNADDKLHLLRALASSSNHPHVKAYITDILNQKPDDDTLITLAGRCWEVFSEPALLNKYLTLLSQREDLSLFSAIFKDLVGIPELRHHVFAVMRSEQRDESLAKAIGLLFR
ncbi:DUF3549 family protein [Thalassotalea euphylliae]|uniref:DUF3549 family protein n=1 Tax=Thalassotalea euphylliae TaxID=1655234 RepID=UPI00363B6CAF